MVEAALEDLPEGTVNIQLVDEASPAGEGLLYLGQASESDKPADEEQLMARGELSLREPLEIPGRRWSLLITPTSEFLGGQASWDAWGVLAGGLSITALLVAYLVTVINHGAKTQRLAAEVTTANEGLKTEVTERKRAEEAERRWANESSVMAEIGRVISSSLEISEVYESLGEQIKRLIPFDRMSLSMVDQDGDVVVPTWVTGVDVPGGREGENVPLLGTLSEHVLRTRIPVIVEADSEQDVRHRFPGLVPNFRPGLRSFMVVPLLDRDSVIGVLRVGSKNRGIYTERHLEILERIGGQIAGAIANSRLYAELVQADDALRLSDEQTRASLGEKEVLLKEINHRVKNNLQIISSLLNLQGRDIEDERALRSFQVSQDRIRAMALVHEKLYQSEDLARIDFGEYIRSLATDLGNTYGLSSRDIDLKIDVEDILLGVDTAIPCGVIVNELVSNSLKHAFPGDRSGEIAISFREVAGQYTMIFKDDGIGLPEDLDISRPSSLGLTIVNALTGQLGGTIDLGHSGGCEVRITFPTKQTVGD